MLAGHGETQIKNDSTGIKCRSERFFTLLEPKPTHVQWLFPLVEALLPQQFMRGCCPLAPMSLLLIVVMQQVI